MNTVRYMLALLVVATFPGVILGWLMVHALLRVWRRVGPAVTYVAFAIVMIVPAVLIYSVRARLFAIEFGVNAWTIAAAALCYATAVLVEIQCWKHLSLATLIGLPELAPHQDNQRLLQEGIYAQVRHPRYLGLLLGVLAVALFTNYLAAYAVVAAAVVGLYLVTVLEERELLERFADTYENYRQHVPRFIPGRW